MVNGTLFYGQTTFVVLGVFLKAGNILGNGGN